MGSDGRATRREFRIAAITAAIGWVGCGGFPTPTTAPGPAPSPPVASDCTNVRPVHQGHAQHRGQSSLVGLASLLYAGQTLQALQ